MSRWRLAARLAWREVIRRPARMLLVALLIAVPVMGMAMASTITHQSNAEAFSRQWGPSADLVVHQPLDDPFIVADHVPADASITSGLSGHLPIETAGGRIVDVQLSEPGAMPATTDDHGHRPRSVDEAWLSAPLLHRLDLHVGDDLTLENPAGTWTIVGSGRSAEWLDDEVLVVGSIDRDDFRPDALGMVTQVDLPAGATPADVASVEQQLAAWSSATGIESSTSSSPTDTNVGEVLAWSWVIGALSLAVTGIIVAAAFATSARRQLVTIGLLSSNGAPERVIRRSLALQGTWAGLAGSVLGVAAGLVGVQVLRGRIEQLLGHAVTGHGVAPLDLVVIIATGVVAATLAALLPAVTASRVPVAAALAGRRPVGVVPRWLVPLGLASFASGVLLLLTGPRSGGNGTSATLVASGVLVLAGVCLASPVAIDAMSRISVRAGGSWRFAGRSLGRTRGRSAAVVTAIAVTVAAGVAAISAISGVVDAGSHSPWPRDAVVASAYPAAEYQPSEDIDGAVDYAPISATAVDISMQERIAAIVPSGRWYPRRSATWDPPPVPDQGLTLDSDGTTITFGPETGIVIADDATMDLYELGPADRAELERTGALLVDLDFWPGWSDIGHLQGRVDATTGAFTFPLAVRASVAAEMLADEVAPMVSQTDTTVGTDAVMMTASAARAAGFDVVTAGGFLRSDAPLTREQSDALDQLLGDNEAALGSIYRAMPLPDDANATVWYVYDDPGVRISRPALQGIVVGGALAVTLLVVAIGLALAAAESRDERDILVAVGARPRTMRSMAGVKAVVLTTTGVALGVPAGLIPSLAEARSIQSEIHAPWLGVAGLVIVIPAVAGGMAWAASSIAQRLRPVRMSTLAVD